MPFYEIRVEAIRYVCVKADNVNDARKTAVEETTGCGWSQAEAHLEEFYGDGTGDGAKKFIAEYRRDDKYYERNDQCPPTHTEP